MDHEPTICHQRAALSVLSERAIAAGAPSPVASEAARVTSARFPRGTRVSQTRLEAYFWGVVRRRALQGAAPVVSRRLVIASLQSELLEAGHSPEAVRREVARLYGEASATALTAKSVA